MILEIIWLIIIGIIFIVAWTIIKGRTPEKQPIEITLSDDNFLFDTGQRQILRDLFHYDRRIVRIKFYRFNNPIQTQGNYIRRVGKGSGIWVYKIRWHNATTYIWLCKNRMVELGLTRKVYFFKINS